MMKVRLLISILTTLMLVFLIGCQESSSDNSTTKTPTPILEPIHPDAQGKVPGTYCFEGKESNLALNGTLTYSEGAMTEGYLKGVIVDPSNGNESIFNVSFKGSFKHDTLYVEVISDEFATKSTSNQKWVWKNMTLFENNHQLSERPCI
jgi:hypothetical protein